MIDFVEIDERIAKCEKILVANPQSQIFAALAEAYRKKGDIDRAQDICIQGLRLHPDYPSARIVMTKIYMGRGDFNSALEELKKAVAGVGRTRAIDTLEAELLIRLGKKAEANTLLLSLAGSDPADENVQSLFKLLKGDDLKDASPRKGTRNFSVEVPIVNAVTYENKGKRDLPLSQAISVMKVMPRVLGVLAVSHNGLLLDGRFDSLHVKEEFAALSKGIFDSASGGSLKIGCGEVREILLETKSSKIWLFHKSKYILVVFTRDDASMGALKLKIDELFEDVIGSEALQK